GGFLLDGPIIFWGALISKWAEIVYALLLAPHRFLDYGFCVGYNGQYFLHVVGTINHHLC
ncbi:hypothetical protein ACJX0J_037978, partial [Zea mays]